MGTPEEPVIPRVRLLTQQSIPVRELKFRSRFSEIPRHEALLKYIPCIWRKEMGKNLRGGLYISENHIAFYCASKTVKATVEQRKVLIELMAVVHVTKERSLSIFPDSIGIQTVSGEKYVFGQLFARNTVYKSLCHLCSMHPSSRRSSQEPCIFTTGSGDHNFEDPDDECDIDSAAVLYRRGGRASPKDHSTSPSLSSSVSTTPPDLKRTLSVVREVSHDESEPQSGRAAFLLRSTSTSHRNPVEPVCSGDRAAEDSWFDRHLMMLLRLIVGILLLTATVSVYQTATRSATIARTPAASLDHSLGEFRLASQSVIQVAEQARLFLNSFIQDELRAAK